MYPKNDREFLKACHSDQRETRFDKICQIIRQGSILNLVTSQQSKVINLNTRLDESSKPYDNN